MLKIKTMRAEDIAIAIRLSDQEKWGVTRNDLERIRRLDTRGSFVAHLGNRDIGLTTTVSYGKRLAWIGNVIVDRHNRGKHIGQDLVEHAVDYLQKSGVKHIALYCFKETARFYEKLGFVKDVSFLRLIRGALRLPSRRSADIRPERPLSLRMVLAADKKAFGADRSKLLRLLISEGAGWYLGSSHASGGTCYLVVKDYLDMCELGPWVCINPERSDAKDMLLNALRKIGDRRIEIACLGNNRKALAILGANRFRVVREGYRMYFHSRARIGVDGANYALGFLDKG
jgi:predicted N-acetyltransferase YhbS